LGEGNWFIIYCTWDYNFSKILRRIVPLLNEK